MLIIKDIIKTMKATISDADKYSRKAVEYKESYPELSVVYCSIAEDHLNEINELHKQVVTIIEKQKETNNTIIPIMQSIWDFEHEMITEEVNMIKLRIKEYNE